jgi:hypothetical protein
MLPNHSAFTPNVYFGSLVTYAAPACSLSANLGNVMPSRAFQFRPVNNPDLRAKAMNCTLHRSGPKSASESTRRVFPSSSLFAQDILLLESDQATIACSLRILGFHVEQFFS